MGCKCQKCGKMFKMDLIVSDNIWKMITPAENKKGGLLCPSCIVKMIEKLYGYSAFRLICICGTKKKSGL
jgi:hypothetical protein